MTPIAPHVTAFFEQRLPLERRASEHTRDSYAYAFKLLLTYASQRLAVTPSWKNWTRWPAMPPR